MVLGKYGKLKVEKPSLSRICFTLLFKFVQPIQGIRSSLDEWYGKGARIGYPQLFIEVHLLGNA